MTETRPELGTELWDLERHLKRGVVKCWGEIEVHKGWWVELKVEKWDILAVIEEKDEIVLEIDLNGYS